jgi:hypothetical protein
MILNTFCPGATASSTFIAALIAFFLTLLASFIIRLFIEPSKLFYREKERADAAEHDLQRRFTPQIDVFLDSDDHGVAESPTEIQAIPPQVQTIPPQRGPSSKWVQFSVSCATNAPLIDCEAWLTGVQRIDGNAIGPQLVEEHIHCQWSHLRDT